MVASSLCLSVGERRSARSSGRGRCAVHSGSHVRHWLTPRQLSSAQHPGHANQQERRMSSIRKVVHIDASPALVWDALRDVGQLHKRLVPGFVKDAHMEGNTRVVTFGNGMVAREEIIGIDDDTRRVAWAIVGGQFRHYNGAAR